MALNKDKLKANAQKFLQRGQLDKAIKELQRLVDEDPRDVRTILKIGDLQARKGEIAAAVQNYSQVAQFHTDQGFFLKSVAVYKQILKISPDHVAVNRKLGELYRQLNLHSDALAQYQGLIELHTRANQPVETLQAMRVVAELDPHNIRLRLSLAEAQSQHGFVDEAKGQLAGLANELKSLQRFGDYAQVAEGLLKLAPSDLHTAHDLATMYLDHHEPKRALATLHACFRVNPRDVTTLALLVQSFRALEQLDKALFLLRELAKIHKDKTDPTEYHATLREILILQPDDAEARAATPSIPTQSLAYTQDMPLDPPDLMQANDDMVIAEISLDESSVGPEESVSTFASPLVEPPVAVAAPAAHLPNAGDPHLLSKLLRQADVYRKYNLHDKARDVLGSLQQQLAQHVEHHAAAHDTMCALCRLHDEVIAYEATWYAVTKRETPSVTVSAAAASAPPVSNAPAEPVSVPDESNSADDDMLAERKPTPTSHTLASVSASYKPRYTESDPVIGSVRATPQVQFTGTHMADASVNFADLAEEIDLEISASQPAPSTTQIPMEAVLTAFKQGIAATVDQQDGDTHYHLGLAYRDMGLFDDAIDALQLACAAQGTTDQHVAAFHMLGQCYLDKGDTERARGCYERALQYPNITTDQQTALHYELGRIYDTLQRYKDAVHAFRRVYDLNPHFRDVALRLCHIEERLQQ